MIIKFCFNLDDKYLFEPELFIPKKRFLGFDVDDHEIGNLVFHIGMIELLSYWKTACPPNVIIKPAYLSPNQVGWWKNLYFHGLGEFFYTNGIDADPATFMNITTPEEQTYRRFSFSPNAEVILPVGGGKDSLVTLELLKNAGLYLRPLIMNPRPASLHSSIAAGYHENESLIVHRALDSQLLKMNKAGFLNGHTPFSALLAFVSLLTARLTRAGTIALSNESSANEPTIPGTDINHQYSKSLDFERDFRDYVSTYISDELNYFSFLRPLNELQIGKLFAGLPQYFDIFKSCNVGSKTDSWCGKCPKCLFTFIILSPFIREESLLKIFGRNLLDDQEMLPVFKDLTGLTDAKPFECVGTVDEINAAIAALIRDGKFGKTPVLLEWYRKSPVYEASSDLRLEEFLQRFDHDHFLPAGYEMLIKKAIQ